MKAPASLSTSAARVSFDELYAQVGAVVDPEIPVVTVADLGILRHLEVTDKSVAIAHVSPTYTGCPAVMAIESAIADAITNAGYEPRIQRVLSPPWTTDFITEQGRLKLKRYGIAPPVTNSRPRTRALFSRDNPACPQCDSTDTTCISEFGSTACKALYRCNQCAEPFDYFKCL